MKTIVVYWVNTSKLDGINTYEWLYQAKRTIVTASTQIIEGAYPTEGCTNKAVRGDQCDNCRHMLNPTELIDPKCKVSISSTYCTLSFFIWIDCYLW
jgi:methionyl-tRNA synthetase